MWKSTKLFQKYINLKSGLCSWLFYFLLFLMKFFLTSVDSFSSHLISMISQEQKFVCCQNVNIFKTKNSLVLGLSSFRIIGWKMLKIRDLNIINTKMINFLFLFSYEHSQIYFKTLRLFWMLRLWWAGWWTRTMFFNLFAPADRWKQDKYFAAES